MTEKTKHNFKRNFAPRGAVRRGIVFVAIMWVVAYLPQVAEALTPVAEALTNK